MEGKGGKVWVMKVHVANHPLISHKLTVLRDERTDSPTFRLLVSELVTLLAYEATRDVRTKTVSIKTPVTETTGLVMADPRPVVVPILRAGLGMLDGMTKLLPTAQVGFLGMVRDEETLQASTYANRLPEDLSGRQVFVLDPMLATGGSLAHACKILADRGAPQPLTIACVLAAPEGEAGGDFWNCEGAERPKLPPLPMRFASASLGKTPRLKKAATTANTDNRTDQTRVFKVKPPDLTFIHL